MAHISETETVIKRIVPYLQRRGYDLAKDLSFEEPSRSPGSPRAGFIDILIQCGRKAPVFLIEAKRDGTKITAKHRKQALDYGEATKCLFVALTNGKYFELLNVKTKGLLYLNGSALDRIPTRADLLSSVLTQLKAHPEAHDIKLSSDKAIPYRPGLPLSKLNHLIKQCHNTIRKIEKNEEHAFSDFSKILFLKLLEEKWDIEGVSPPYSYQFYRLAETKKEDADQVPTAIKAMIATIQSKTKYGNVLADPIKLKKDATYLAIVKAVAGVSFADCELDTKGAAFEYFVRATLKGKKLGQYFTPRPLVKLMLHLGRYKQIVNSLKAGQPFKVLDPACGTGGFLVYALNLCTEEVAAALKKHEIHNHLAKEIISRLKEETFFGIDAHEGVASSAKMNMIIAGDGHNNIRCADSLAEKYPIPAYKTGAGTTCKDGKAHLILTNPPFGTSEAESLSSEELGDFEVPSTRGQSLFIQKMIASALPDSRIVTVIDEGVLNTSTHTELRRHIMKTCRIEFVIALPDETFKPNKINVKSSVLVLQRREHLDEDISDDYPIGFIKLESLGYEGSGDEIRGFNLEKLISELEALDRYSLSTNKVTDGYQWSAYAVHASQIKHDRTSRFDMKYWHPALKLALDKLRTIPGTKTIQDLNTIATKRGKSPPAAEYVSEHDGFALVVKAGSSITKTGELLTNGDYIEEPLYQEYVTAGNTLQDGDILLSSTGDGTIGKCAVYRNYDKAGKSRPGVADGHVTVIRVDQSKVHPEYLCDFLRKGLGYTQLYRLYTGSTGLVEITPEDANEILVPALPTLPKQKTLSQSLRAAEVTFQTKSAALQNTLRQQEEKFAEETGLKTPTLVVTALAP